VRIFLRIWWTALPTAAYGYLDAGQSKWGRGFGLLQFAEVIHVVMTTPNQPTS